MRELVSFAKCKRCNTQIEVPPLPVIVGENAVQKAARLGALEMNTICKHLVKFHPEAREHMLAWGQVFSEFYYLAAFDLEKCPVLLDQFDAQRILLLRLCQREFIAGSLDVLSDHVAEVCEYYEETKRVKELEAAGYTITRGFMGESQKAKVVI